MSEHKALGQEYPPPDEGQAIQQLRVILSRDQFVQPGQWRRGQHPHHQGCVKASFEVVDGLPADMRQGVFKHPATYQAIIRFSNGQQDDERKPDVHGMAIKLLGVAGEKIFDSEKSTQDFILADNPVFFARGVRHMLEFVVARDAGTPIPAIAKTHPKLVGFVKPPPPSPLENRYWSQTPYLLGQIAVKYSVLPSAANHSGAPLEDSPLCLHNVLRDWLAHNPAQFDFFVQRQTDAEAMPVEDPTVEWCETLSPPVKVATITIAPQTFDSPGQMAFCEAMSYSPWHALPVHRPLGGINRARKFIYQDSSTLRHQAIEPTGKEAFWNSP
jgi:hypothetical protein